MAACEALAAGLDGQALRVLAACTRTEAETAVPKLLPAALDELGLSVHPAGSTAGQEEAVRALARRLLAGHLTPRELARRIHHHVGHDLPMAERLAALDDEYDLTGQQVGRTAEQLDAEVTVEARRLAR